LIAIFHHIIADNWSLGLFSTELEKCYLAFHNRHTPELKPVRLQYVDYAGWQRTWIGSTECERQLSYWTSRLAGAKFLFDLSADGVRPTEQSFSGSSQARRVPEDRITFVRNIAAKYNGTPFMVSLAVLQVLLWQYTGETDVLAGIPVAARSNTELEDVIGNFVNFVVVRGDLTGDPALSDVICAVRASMLEALANQDVPFERVVEVLHPTRSLDHHPIFQVLFTSIKAAAPCKSFGGLEARPYNIEASGTAFDLSLLCVEESPDTWWVRAEYRSQLFSNHQISDLLDHYIHLLGCIAARPTVRLSQLDLPSNWPATKLRRGPWGASDTSKTVSAAARTPWNGANTDPTERRCEVRDQSGDLVKETLTALWAKVLGTDPPTITSNFFELGGHSLMALRLAAEIGRVYGTNFPVSLVFQAPTIEDMAQRLPGLISSASSVVCIQKHGSLPPFFCGGSMRQLLDLSRGLGSDQPFFQLDAFAVQQQRFSANEPLYASVPDLAARFRRDILSIQPAGPYFLGGMCDGGIIALEIALQLQEKGHEVALLAQFDTPVNGYWRKRPIDLFREGYDLIVSGRLTSRLHKRFYARKMPRLPMSEEEQITNLIWSAIRAYRPNRVFQGEIQIFRGPRPLIWFYEDVVTGWTARASKGIRVHEVSGQHGKLFGHPVSQRMIANIIEQARHRSLT
jgi:thioesterase domain-containing protein/acyl carrier protein